MAALQSSLLLCKLPLLPHSLSSSPFPKRPYHFPRPHSRPRTLPLSCTFHPENLNFSSNPGSATGGSGISGEIPDFSEKFEDSGADSEKLDAESERLAAAVGVEMEMGEAGVKLVGEEERRSRFSIVALMVGAWTAIGRVVSRVLSWFSGDLFGFWRNWWQESKVKRLTVEADANPMDAAKQGALLAELNKHKQPQSVVARFEQGEYAADSTVVAEYIRALVATNSISEYLPDEKSGKPATLPALLQELKHRSTGNMDEAVLSPGISKRRPLHVVMVDPPAWSKIQTVLTNFATVLGILSLIMLYKFLIFILLCYLTLSLSLSHTHTHHCIFVCYLKGWHLHLRLSFSLFLFVYFVISVLAGRVLPKYISLGGIGVPGGAGTTSSYTPKEGNMEVMPEKTRKTFKDVKGCDEAKEELEEVVEYLKNPDKFTRLGGKLPKGILLTGAPGTGKTLLAKAIAGEAGVPFFYKAGSEFEEMYVGVGARRVRSLFQTAKKKAPCIIFIDEIDAVGSTRKQFEGHTKKTLHQLLVEMDGFDENEGIILIAATNLPEILDPALTRPGRFDKHIVVSSPDVKGREEILKLYVQGKPVDDDVDVKSFARGTAGFTGADLANLVNTAAIQAAVDGTDKITAAQMESAKDRILMGTARRTLFMSEESKKLTAYHESGHAIVAFSTECADPIHKATIMPRGSSLGMTALLPSSDETSVSKKQLLARLDVLMGGRVAEELIFGKDYVTTGASNDLQKATDLARHMVSECGMSDTVGPIHITSPSAEMQSKIDAEVVKLLREAYNRVKTLLKKQEEALHALASALLQYETLTLEEIKGILNPFREGQFSEQQQEQVQQEEADPIF